MKSFIFYILSTLFLGCYTNLEVPAGYAECPVCKANNDLACLYVKKNSESNQHKFKDKTVYFCSKECKDQHLKEISNLKNKQH